MAKPSAKLTRWCLLSTFAILSFVFLYISFVPGLPDISTFQTNLIWSSATSDLMLKNAILTNQTQELKDALDIADTKIKNKHQSTLQLHHKLGQAMDNLKQAQNTNELSKGKVQELQKQLNDGVNDINEMKKDLDLYSVMNKNLSNKIKDLLQSKDALEHQLANKTEEFNGLRQTPNETGNVNTDHYTRDNMEHSTSYTQWIRGIGDGYVSNDASSCVYPEITDELSSQMINADVYQCEERLFSNLYARTLTVDCGMESKPMIAEFDDIFHSKVDIDEFISLDKFAAHHNSSVFVVDLKDTTQITWIKCGDEYNMHISLISLEQNNRLYQYKKERLREKLGVYGDSEIFPPNIVIFVVDSISRSQFIRSAPMTADYLSNLMVNPDSESTVLEWFRYSTVGHGHRVNLAALGGGTCITQRCIQTAYRNCIGLSHFYNKLGYFVPGFTEYSDADAPCDAHLSSNDLFPDNCLNINYAQQFVLQSLNNKPSDIPYFMMIDSKGNINLDKYVRDLIENIDKTNTILHIISADGGYNHETNIYGHWESNNPVSIMILPQYLVNKEIIDIDTLKQNQQKHINHYDMNLFYKELMLKFMEHTNGLNTRIFGKYKKFVYDTLPKVYAKGDFVFSKSIMNDVISDDRSCNSIDDGYCFCDVLRKNSITKKSIKFNTQNVQNIINEINNLTGNGALDCVKLDADDFQIAMFLSNDYIMHLVIRETPSRLGIKRESKYRKYDAEGKILSYSADIYVKGNNKPFNLLKVNLLSKYGGCLTTDYDVETYKKYGNLDEGIRESMKPLFVNKKLNIKMMKDRNNTMNDLSLCRCKEQ